MPALHRLGVKVVLITGDASEVASSVAAQLGIDEVFAEVLPEDRDQRTRRVSDLQARGLPVAMVGDGVNDAHGLAQADVGIAIGAGTDAAIESAGLVLASSDPRSVIGVIRLSRASYRKMVQNLALGAGYNVFAIPWPRGRLHGVASLVARRRGGADERIHHRGSAQRSCFARWTCGPCRRAPS